MGERLNRTFLNLRWWLILPLVPIVLCLMTAQWLFRLPLMALDATEQVSFRVFKWARNGARK